MNNLLMNVLTAVIVALIGVITTQLLPFLTAKKDEALAKMRRTKWAWAADIIDAAVRAVEQTVAEDVHGINKKNLALKYIMPWLSKNGINLTEDEIDQLIEAAVQAMNAEQLEVETETTEESEDV